MVNKALKPAKRHPPRFEPGTRLKDSYGRIYLVGEDGAFRREDGGNHGLTRAEKKAAKKQRTRARIGKP